MIHARAVALITLLIFCAAITGCYSYHAVPISQLNLAGEELANRKIRITRGAETIELLIHRIDYPFVEGREIGGGEARIDLREVDGIEIYELDGGKTAVFVVGGVAAAVVLTALIVAATKDSCPFVYVDRGEGYELVGEAYAGAAFRSLQRDDLLPLPEILGGPVGLRLSDEAHETQYTDLLELWLVDHAPQVRALSTVDNEVLLVGEAVPPLSVHDGLGNDIGSNVAALDGQIWSTDLERFVYSEPSSLREELVAVFPHPGDGATPILELHAGNTPWADLVMGRFFALFGDRLGRFITDNNATDARDRLVEWRDREGLDLRVEVLAVGGWKTVASVPTVGPIALRRIAVPLPPLEGDVKVRLSAGLGFWRFDQLAMSAGAGTAPKVRRLSPDAAMSSKRGEEGESLRTVDGHYQVLHEVGERLDLSFTSPAVTAGMVRSAFLFTNGYYNVHQPVQSAWTPGTLKTLRDEEASLARFGLDLLRHYARLARITPAEVASGRSL